jgi:hypothetical protein
VPLEELGKLKRSNDIGTETHNLPACSIVSRPTTLPRVLLIRLAVYNYDRIIYVYKLLK